MSRNVILWILAFLITVASAIYQRKTGPTYPIDGEFMLGGAPVEYSLDRSHGGDDDHKVEIQIHEREIEGVLSYRRYKTDDDWTYEKMNRDEGYLVAYLPHQPPAGKLEYRLRLTDGENVVYLPEKGSVVIRFKGAVPAVYLIPHIIFMFAAMLVSTRTGFQAIFTNDYIKIYSIVTFILLVLGGLVFGPIVQKYAFGDYWTGFPFGIDLTDNKVLIAAVGWLIALLFILRNRKSRIAAILAALLMFAIFLIPHSTLGSELDYETGEIKQADGGVPKPGYAKTDLKILFS